MKKMYEQLIANLRAVDEYDTGYAKLIWEAADAIEALSVVVRAQKAVLDKFPRWIPVTERLPEEWLPVLGLIQYHDEKEPPAQQVLWYLGNGHWRETWRGDMIEGDVTHWMPLPEPPKEET